MEPALKSGALVVAARKQLAVGQIVVAKQAGREVVKRIERINGDKVYLIGDNRFESDDSRQVGPISKQAILGVAIMKFHLASATKAPAPISNGWLIVPFAYAGLLLVMILAQLMTFEKFIPLIASYGIWGGDIGAKITTVLIVTVEIFALPFLLRMDLSPLARLYSVIFSLAVSNNGLFSTLLPVKGVWVLVIIAALFVLAAVSFYVLRGQKVFSSLNHR